VANDSDALVKKALDLGVPVVSVGFFLDSIALKELEDGASFLNSKLSIFLPRNYYFNLKKLILMLLIS
jgi:hypothetical protein